MCGFDFIRLRFDGSHSGYRPEPPFLINALADANEAVAENTTGFISWRASHHARFFRALTPQYWLQRGQPAPEAESVAVYAQDDRAYLESAL